MGPWNDPISLWLLTTQGFIHESGHNYTKDIVSLSNSVISKAPSDALNYCVIQYTRLAIKFESLIYYRLLWQQTI